MKKAMLISTSLLAALALGGSLAPAVADHVRIAPSGTVYGAPMPAANPAPVTVTPAPSTVVVTPGTVIVPPAPPAGTAQWPSPLRVEQIRANQVRANTIYANRIEAHGIRGMMHHTNTVTVNPPQAGEIVAGEVSASVIYADAIAADEIVADHVYARELEMSPSRFVIAPLSGRVVRRQSP